MIGIISQSARIVHLGANRQVKKVNLPSFLDDYNSFWNPLLEAYVTESSQTCDESHVLSKRTALGLSREEMHTKGKASCPY